MYKGYIKRIFDIMISLCGIVILSPLFLVLMIIVRTRLGSPVFFHQKRPGKDEKVFSLYKFRTMTDARDQNGKLLPDSQRLTSLGKFLRSSSLDELPELINILKGDMSFIGPRPLLIEYLPYYSPKEKLRHSVRPGLTGLAQASGRNYLDWDRRLQKDVEYVENLSLAMDIRVIYLTIKTVFSKSNSVAEDTNAVEGNFAEIRKKRISETGSLEIR